MTVKYSPNEEKLLKIVKRKKGKKLSSLEIVEMRYPDMDERPKFARQSVVCVLNGLVRKTQKVRKVEGFAVCKSDRNGPHPNKYWVE